jgi:hypothetical protein
VSRTIDVRKAAALERGMLVLTPQQGMGVLLAHAITDTEDIEEGKWIEVSTDDGRQHLLGREELVVVL